MFSVTVPPIVMRSTFVIADWERRLCRVGSGTENLQQPPIVRARIRSPVQACVCQLNEVTRRSRVDPATFHVQML